MRYPGALLLPSVLLILLGALYLFLLRPEAVGLLYDDGMYLMAAKALAHGEGYRLSGIEGQPFFHKYPPLYPLFLSAVLLITPAFPQNVFYLKAFNIVMALLTLGLLYYHARKQQQLPCWVGLGLVAWLGTHWQFAGLSVEVMSEPLFMALSMLAIVLSERYFKLDTPLPKRRLIILIILTVAAFYTRSIGIILIFALGLWLYIAKNRKVTAMVYWSSCFALMVPWMLWSGSRPDTTEIIGNFLLRTFQETYFQSFRMDLRYEYSLLDMTVKGFQELIGNFSTLFFPLIKTLFPQQRSMLSELISLGVGFALVLPLTFRALQSARTGVFSLMGLYSACYLCALPFWSFHQYYPRFILVILPLLFLSLIQSIREQRFSAQAQNLLLVALLITGIFSNLLQLGGFLQKTPHRAVLLSNKPYSQEDYTETNRFIREQTPANAILYSENGDESYFYALYTNRKAIDAFVFLPTSRLNELCPPLVDAGCISRIFLQQADVRRQMMIRKRTQYFILNRLRIPQSQRNEPAMPGLLVKYAPEFVPVFQSRFGAITVYRFQPRP